MKSSLSTLTRNFSHIPGEIKTKSFLLFTLLLLLVTTEIFAQSPQKFNYQGIARDAKGNPISLQQMRLKLSVLPAADATQAEYEESQLITTNEFGLYSLQIGNGETITGSMDKVKWETGNKYIRVAIDIKGGHQYQDIGTTQLLSVPYALYADKAGTARQSTGSNHDTRSGGVNSDISHSNADVNYLSKFTALNEIGKSQLYDNGSNVGIGTNVPAWALHVKKATATYLTVQADANNATAAIRLQDINGTSGELGISKFGDNISGNFMGISRKRMGVLNNLTGPFVVNAGGYMFFGQTVGATQINRLMIDSATGNVGIGTTVANQPTQKLDVNGQLRIRGGNPGAGKVLTSDALGNAVWGSAVNTLSGTTNYLPKFTPNGSTLGNSSLIDNNYLIYNASAVPGIDNSIYLKTKNNGGSNWMTVEGTAAGSYTFINAVDSGMNNKGFSCGQSSALYSSDSLTTFIYSPSLNATIIGTESWQNFFIKNQTGKMGNVLDNAHFTMSSTYDTAAFFSTTSNNYLNDGIVRSEYKGSNIYDHVAVLGKSVPDTNTFWGIGVKGIGGYAGVYGLSEVLGGGNEGIRGLSKSNSNNSGGLFEASEYSTPGLGNKSGVNAYCQGGAINYGVLSDVQAFGPGTSWGGYFLGKQTGVYGQADSASASQSDNGTLNGFKEAVGISGFAGTTCPTFGYKNIGVLGRGKTNFAYWNIGVNAEASGGTYNYALIAEAPVAAGNLAGKFYGDVNIAGNLSKSGGTFKIDHPEDPANKYLIHSFVESPDMMNVYNGNVVTDANGIAVVTLPSYFEAENKDFKYQLTVVDNGVDFIMAKVSKKISNNTFEIRSSKPNTEISWQITGVRQDAWANANRVVDVVEKPADEKGLYIHPELFGASPTLRVGPKGNPDAVKVTLPTPEEQEKIVESFRAPGEIHKMKMEEVKNEPRVNEDRKPAGNKGRRN